MPATNGKLQIKRCNFNHRNCALDNILKGLPTIMSNLADCDHAVMSRIAVSVSCLRAYRKGLSPMSLLPPSAPANSLSPPAASLAPPATVRPTAVSSCPVLPALIYSQRAPHLLLPSERSFPTHLLYSKANLLSTVSTLVPNLCE